MKTEPQPTRNRSPRQRNWDGHRLLAPVLCWAACCSVTHKKRLAGHRSCSFAVRSESAYSRLSRVGLICDVGFRNRLRNCPTATVMANGWAARLAGDESANASCVGRRVRDYRLWPKPLTWPCQPEYPSSQIVCLHQRQRTTRKVKSLVNILSFLLIVTLPGHLPKIVNDALMQPNDQAQAQPPTATLERKEKD